MKKPIIVLFFFYAISLCIEACCPGEGMDLCNAIDSTSVEIYDNTGDEPVLVTDSIKAANMTLRLNVNFFENTCKQRFKLRFVNTAYATKCVVNNRYYVNDTIKNIVISTDKPYTQLHPAGTGLNEFFKMPELVDPDGFNSPHTEYNIRALEAPSKTDVYTYKILLIMKSGRTYEAISNPIKVML